MLIDCLASVLSILIGNTAILILFDKIIGYTVNVKKLYTAMTVFCSVVLCVASTFFIKDRDIAESVVDAIHTISFIVLPCFIFDQRKKSIFFWTGFIFSVTADSVVLGLIKLLKISKFCEIYYIYSLLFIAVVSLMLIISRSKRFIGIGYVLERIPVIMYILIIIVDFSTYYSINLKTDPEYHGDVSDFLMLASTFIIVFCISYVVYKYVKTYRSQKEAETELKYQMRLFEEVNKKNQEVRDFRHDIKNNLFSVQQLIKLGNYDDAGTYLEELNKTISQTDLLYRTGNRLADAIITDKSQKAALEYGIDIAFSGMIPKSGISDYDLSPVLANALDNAIEGSMDSAPCKIQINACKRGNAFLLIIRNPVKKKVEIVNNRVKTCKEDKANHGIGLRNMEQAVRKYSGYVEISSSATEFVYKAGFFLNMEGDKIEKA